MNEQNENEQELIPSEGTAEGTAIGTAIGTDEGTVEEEPAPTEDISPEEGPAETADAPVTEEKSASRPSLIFGFFEYLEILVFSICAVLLAFTFCVRLCRVDGNSMRNTLHDGEMLLTTSLSDPQPGDIIVFHMTSRVNDRFNEPLVKRVIATEGQTVRIDFNTQTLYVDGQPVNEPYAAYLDSQGHEIGLMLARPSHHYDSTTGIFEATVPEGCLFVMGDNRNNSADSRTLEVGFVDSRRVLGKVVCRLKPFSTFD